MRTFVDNAAAVLVRLVTVRWSARRWVLIAALALEACWPAQSQNNGPVNAVSLDGTSGYLSVPNGVWFNGNFTVEGWVFVRSYNNWSRLIDFADGPNTNNVYLALSAGTTGVPTMGVFTNNNGTPTITAGSALPLNQWVHLAGTLNGTLGTIYTNGVAAGSGTLNIPPAVTRTNNYIGRSNYAQDSDANAMFDEIRIWNVARTQSQILSDMHRSLAGTETGLIGYWPFDEGTGSTSADTSGHGQTATLLGGTSWTASTAPITAGPGNALSFNSASCQLVNIPHQAALNAYPLTVMAWFMVPTTNTGGGGAVVNKYVSASGNGYQIALGSQLHAWYFRDASDNVGNMGAGAVNDGVWHQTTMVIDASGGRLYLDGVLKSSLPWSGTAGACTTTQPLEFGVYPGDSCFTGQIDEVSIWNTALTTNQIQTYMHRSLLGTEANLVAYYRLDEGTGTNTVDATGNGYNGTLQNGPAWVASGAFVGAPQVTTLAATAVAGTSATLNGAVNPEGQSSLAWFQWGTSTAYGNTTTPNSMGSSFTSTANSSVLTSLALGSHHYRAVGTNTGGTNFGQDMTFTITALPPVVTTLAVSNISATAATLAASVNPEGSATTVYFAYGATTSYGTTNSAGSIGSGSSPVIVTSLLSSLTPGTLYHFLVTASNSFGVVSGTDSTFQTPAAPPALATLAVSNITMNAATLNASVTPNGAATTVYFAYGTTTSYGTTNSTGSIGSGSSPVIATGLLASLTPATLYHFLVTASNSAGTVSGTDSTFTTLDTFTGSSIGMQLNGGETPVWGDYKNNGLQDVLLGDLIGLNNTNGTFSQTTYGENAASYGGQAWADFDNDGYLDILVTGTPNNATPSVHLWHNNGNGTFTSLGGTGLPAVFESCVAVGDFDNDGRQDVLVAGYQGEDQFHHRILISGIWRNNGNGTFTQIPIPGLNGILFGGVAVGDFDNDGYLDFIICGQSSNSGITQLWRNNGDGTFTQKPIGGLPQIYAGSVAVGDFNNDGKLDFVITGEAIGNVYLSQVWTNGGNWVFTQDTQVSLPGTWDGQVAVGDYDNDGNPDILLAGLPAYLADPSTAIAQVWKNLGDGNFTNINASLPVGEYNGLSWADYNNDGRLDFVLSDYNGGIEVTLEQNNSPVTNTPPTAPSGLGASPARNGVVLTWNAASDAQTPTAGLSYNIRVGTSPGGINIVSPAANPTTGFRRVPQMGNAQLRLTSILTNLPAGTYYWSVQAIDGAFAGSSFAPEAQFTITNPWPAVVTGATGQITSGSAVLNGTVVPYGNNATTWFQWDTSTNFSSNTVSVLVSGTNAGPVSVSLPASGLSPLTQYYYRISASNIAGQSYGNSSNFTTIAVVPPSINNIVTQPGNAFLLQFTGESGLGYTLHDSTNLINWNVVTNLTAGTDGLFQYSGSISNNYPALFFRLSAP